MILGTKNAPGRLKTDIGGPCPKPFINITFWELFRRPRGGKTDFGRQKPEYHKISGNFAEKPNFGAKIAKFAKSCQTSQNVTFFALKACLKLDILLFWGSKAPKTPKWEENHEIP